MPTQRRKEKRERKSAGVAGGRETPGPLAPLFICFFLPLGPPYVNWASQECCLFYLRSSLRVFGPSFVLFSQAFPFFVF